MPVVSAISTIGCPTPVKILSQQETINSENYAFKPEINSFVKAKPVFWRLLALMAWNHIYIYIYIIVLSNDIQCLQLLVFFQPDGPHECDHRYPCKIHVYIYI